MDGPENHSSFEQQADIDKQVEQFKHEFKTGGRPQIEDYLAKHPELRAQLLPELVALEIELRQAAGDALSVEEYRERFPESIAQVMSPNLRRLFRRLRAPQSCSDTQPPTVDRETDWDADDDEPQYERLGRYEISKTLGRGGFGVVYLAHDPQLERPVAVKVPRRKRFQRPEQVARFIDEARTAANLKHPLLVAVYDVQQHDGLPYIVQEYIDGQDLGEWVSANHPSFEQIVRLVVGVAEALGYLHEQGLTHCDLKMANVLIDPSGQPHVADFGLAVHESEQAIRRGERFGTPTIMAPEQVRGESHHFDGRTDIWAIGVMLYELLTGREPFRGNSPEELFDEIRTHDPRPIRQIDRNAPRELERICLKCLSKRRKHRYATTHDLREELLAWLAEEQPTQVHPAVVSTSPDGSSSGSETATKIIPKGIRSFDAEDAEFFLELLPGPRDREELPESIRFWKNRIEETNADKTFSVGLIYGPSGCGKSSLVKAGLIPRLSDHVLPIYIEATIADTESRILKQMRKILPGLPAGAVLPAICNQLRLTGAGQNRKVLLVLDQFEQWLYGNSDLKNSPLVDALRQCDGGRLQGVLLVRDDFYVSVNQLFQELEYALQEGNNYALVDRFDTAHAAMVLTKFGQAYGKLDFPPSGEQKRFVSKAICELAEDNKVIGVRVALFAEMLKSRPWVTDSLEKVGGVGGVGVTFLEETFSAKTAPPPHRVHEPAIRRVLKALLPEAGTDIKGSMQPSDKLRIVAGYQENDSRFDQLVHILDSELRLITPTDPEEIDDVPGGMCFQLTHDFLVPSLRDWLTRKQKETVRGRAELRLSELSTAWNAKPEKRHLPAWWEFLLILLLTRKKTWTSRQRKMMRAAIRPAVGQVSLIAAAITIAVCWY